MTFGNFGLICPPPHHRSRRLVNLNHRLYDQSSERIAIRDFCKILCSINSADYHDHVLLCVRQEGRKVTEHLLGTTCQAKVSSSLLPRRIGRALPLYHSRVGGTVRLCWGGRWHERAKLSSFKFYLATHIAEILGLVAWCHEASSVSVHVPHVGSNRRIVLLLSFQYFRRSTNHTSGGFAGHLRLRASLISFLASP